MLAADCQLEGGKAQVQMTFSDFESGSALSVTADQGKAVTGEIRHDSESASHIWSLSVYINELSLWTEGKHRATSTA